MVAAGGSHDDSVSGLARLKQVRVRRFLRCDAILVDQGKIPIRILLLTWLKAKRKTATSVRPRPFVLCTLYPRRRVLELPSLRRFFSD